MALREVLLLVSVVLASVVSEDLPLSKSASFWRSLRSFSDPETLDTRFFSSDQGTSKRFQNDVSQERNLRSNGRRITIQVKSEGCCGKKEKGGFAPLYEGALFYLNGKEVTPARRRGVNLITISRATGKVLDHTSFDTSASRRDGNRIWGYVNDIPDDTIVALSVVEDAAKTCPQSCQDAMKEFGGTDLPLAFRDGYAMVGYKGSHCGTRPSWMKEERVHSSGYKYDAWARDPARSNYGPRPISLVVEIDLDHCL